jgi:Flp pilus assembly pilin Flp
MRSELRDVTDDDFVISRTAGFLCRWITRPDSDPNEQCGGECPSRRFGGFLSRGPGTDRKVKRRKAMLKLAKRFLNDEQGLELSEYAIMAGLVIVLAVAIIITVGGHINGIFNKLANALGKANN